LNILIVDDNLELCDELKYTLEHNKYTVDTASDGNLALDKIFENEYDLIILDIMLPNLNGTEILKELRQEKINTPVLMLTAKSSVQDKIRGLDLGADDYLIKPFSINELLARIRALLRRNSDSKTLILSFKDISLNTKTKEITKNKEIIELTPREFSILEFLMYNQGNIVSRTTIAEHVWGDEFDTFTMSNFIDVHIKNIRKKLNDSSFIKTIRGLGFMVPLK
jgi:DNA-binding response OmpR family regulator